MNDKVEVPENGFELWDFGPEDIDALINNLDRYSESEQRELLKALDEYEEKRHIENCRNDLIAFCKAMQPDYKVGRHHARLANMLMAIERGREYDYDGAPLTGTGLDRMCVNMPPRHGKTQLVSIYFPAWYLGRNPDKKLLMVSHTTDLAVDFGRKVRNLIASPDYQKIFPDTRIASDSKSAGRWDTTAGGQYYACGVGSALAGRGADLLVIDDPHNEQDILNGNLDVFERAYEWYTYGARTRLMPKGRVAVVQCMVADTPVLRPDGSETLLKDIQIGDEVASYKDGRIVSRKVLNKQSNGLDNVFTIKTTSHIVEANRRHPFLVATDEGLIWKRVQNLQVGDRLVSLKGVNAPHGLKQNRVNAQPASPRIRTTEKTRTLRTGLLGITASIKGLCARLTGAINPLLPSPSALLATTGSVGPTGMAVAAQRKAGTHTCATGTESALMSTILCWLNREADVLYAESLLQSTTPGRTGVISYVSITATTPDASGPFSATTVTLPLDIPNPEKQLSPLPSISDFTLTTITSVEPSGRKEVFDIQVEDTENFIANGVVSSNTRWHQDDLTGRLIKDMAQNPLADQFEVVEFPAILEVPVEVDEEFEDSIVNADGVEVIRKGVHKVKKIIEKPLWPEFFDLKALYRTKASMPTFQWNAQYQQNPTAEEGAIVKREWWKRWEKDDPPKCSYIITTVDAAAEKHNRADFTAIASWGVFFMEETDTYNIILLDSIKRRLEFHELKELAVSVYKDREPDAFIVEKKSSGTPLYQEMRRTGMIVQEYTPHRGSGDKTARLNSVADIFKSGLVWAPRTRWAEDLIEEVAGFPFMSNDDLVDVTIMALMRFRQGGFIRLPTDEPEPITYYRQQKAYY